MSTTHRPPLPCRSAVPESGPPARGPRFQSGRLQIDLNGPTAFDVHYTATAPTITLRLDPMVYDLAFDSDQSKSCVAPAGSLGFVPCGSEVRSRAIEATGAFLNIVVPPRIWRDCLAERPAAKRGDVPVRVHRSPRVDQLSKLAKGFVESGYSGGRLTADAITCLAVNEVMDAF